MNKEIIFVDADEGLKHRSGRGMGRESSTIHASERWLFHSRAAGK